VGLLIQLALIRFVGLCALFFPNHPPQPKNGLLKSHLKDFLKGVRVRTAPSSDGGEYLK
jgi:hypothetical protein